MERMDALKTILCTVLFLATPLNSFPPDEIGFTGSKSNTRHHKEITSFAIKKAVGTFIQNNNLSEVVDSSVPVKALYDFFGDDADGLQEFNRRMDEIIQHVKNQEKSIEAHIHCNSEQIEIAHNYIIKLRGQIKDLARSAEPDLSVIREKIGKCIFTLQSFYSGTNWVEMNIGITYRDFGVPNTTLMAVAGETLDTCQDCDNSGADTSSCKNNLLINNMLTSGYKTGQDIQAPYKASGDITSNKGKCGYGGSADSLNGRTTALGGINKDTSKSIYSPHHHLHLDAYYAARTATQTFLIDQEIGIINELQDDVFAAVFNIVKRYKASFGFVIDNTGSMGNDIVAVRKACVDIITDVLGTPNEPTEYVLVTFNDPETATILQLNTTNGTEMINTLKDLDVSGGDDCQEYAISGLSKGIEACKENSKIFFFTDAPAKDEDNRQAMTDTANLKNIELHMFIRKPICLWSERKKRESGRAKREANRETQVYYTIADETGGKVYEITIDELASLAKQLTQTLFPSATALLTFLTLGSSDNDSVTFNVDKTMNNVKITVIGTNSTDDVAISSPVGSVFTKENANILFESPDKVVVTVVNPTPGVYTLTRTDDNPWNINITAQTSVDFDFTLTEVAEDGYLYKVEGNPILGGTYSIFVTVYNLPEDFTVDGMLLTTENQELVHLNMTQLESDLESIYIVSVNLTSESYQISIYGTNWMRTSSYMVYPVKVRLTSNSAPDLYVDMIGNVSYRVENKGTENETFDVIVTDNRGLLTGQTSFTTTIARGESKEIIFQVQGSSAFKTVTYDITVNKSGSNAILQQKKNTIYISQDIPPVCSVDKQSGNCDNTYTNGSCSDVTWIAQATITFVTELKSISGSIGLNVDYGSAIVSPIQVNVSGDCCTPSSYLSIIDEKSNFARCHFYLGEVIYIENKFKSILSTSEKIAIGVVAGIVVACLVCISIFVICLYRGAVRPKLDARKINTLNIKATKDFPEQKDYSAKERFHDDFLALKYDFSSHAPLDTHLSRRGDLQIVEI